MDPTLHRIHTALDSGQSAITNSIQRIEQEINNYKNPLLLTNKYMPVNNL
jgi:predicted DNA-binding protein YlxM (UPF0122 family)